MVFCRSTCRPLWITERGKGHILHQNTKTEDAGMGNDYHLSIKCLDFSFFPEYNLQTILRFRNLIKYCIEQEQISFD